MFRRPKKTVRPRLITTDNTGDEEDNDMDTAETPVRVVVKIEPELTKVSTILSENQDLQPKTSSLLSFGDEDDGETETFQVKKSSVSRRLIKQREKGKKPKKPTQNETKSMLKQEDGKSSDQTFLRILAGREAEAVDMESGSEDEEEEGRINFRPRADNVSEELRRALDRDGIPDANLIHEVRKRRQLARDMGGFIPLDDADRYKADKSRLVREDDNDNSEEEERIDFTVDAAKIARERRIEVFNAARDEERDRASDEESDPEMEEWERQQIRKGVSQIHTGAREAFQGFLMNEQREPPRETSANSYGNGNHFEAPPAFVPQKVNIDDIVSGSKRMEPDMILKKLSDTLASLKLSSDRRRGELSRTSADLELVKQELRECESAKPVLSSRFMLYQKLRGYVHDIVDCLRCKVPEIEILQTRMIDLQKRRTERLIERRRQDTRDQLEELNNNSGLTRRGAEREGRRTRRRRNRELKAVVSHRDGLSSDDEETELESKNYQDAKEAILRDASLVFDDVNEDFGSLEGVLSRFEEWKEHDLHSYSESYISMCIPKCLAPFVKLELLGWDPLVDEFDMKKFAWTRPLLNYGFKADETQSNLASDPDSRLVPSIADKVLIPWIERSIKGNWDPVSVSQTRKLVNVVKRVIKDWSVGANSKSVHSLLTTIIYKFKEAVDNDVFIPIFPKNMVATKSSPASMFSSRQFWSSVKLLDNMSAWAGLLSDKPLQVLALDALLTRYVLLGIRTATDLQESAERARGVVTVLPRIWLTREPEMEVPSGVLQFIRCLISIVQSADCASAANRVVIPEISSILKCVGGNTEAKMLIQKYS